MNASDMHLMRERLLEAALAAPPSEDLVKRILARAQEPGRAATPIAGVDAKGTTPAEGVETEPPRQLSPTRFPWRAARLMLEAACLVGAISLLAWVLVWREEQTDEFVNPDTPKPAQQGMPGFTPLPGSEYEDGERPVLRKGMFWLETGAPLVTAGLHKIELHGGSAMLRVGSKPEGADFAILNPWLDANPKAATPEERKMLNDASKWLVRGTIAFCLVVGAIDIDGELIRAQQNKDPMQEDIDEAFVPADTNKDGELAWGECLAYDRKAHKAEPSEASAREKWVAKYGARIGRDEFLFADVNDDMKLTRAEYRAYLEKNTVPAGKEPDPNEPEEKFNRSDLLEYTKANTEDQWPTLLREADLNKDKALSIEEINKYFMVAAPDEADEEAVAAFKKSFKSADANKDGMLDQKEYAVFSANEYEVENTYYADFLIYIGADDRTETQAPKAKAKKTNPVKVGTIWYAKYLQDFKGRRTAEWKYVKFKITKLEIHGVRAEGVATDETLENENAKDTSLRQNTWDKNSEPGSDKIEVLRIGEEDFECFLYEREYEPEVNGKKQPKVVEKTWVLTTCPAIVVKRVVNDALIEEMLKFVP